MTLRGERPVGRKKVLVDLGVYYASTAINQAVPFLLLPLMTIYLRPEDFGFINTFSALLLIASSVFIGMYATINKQFYARSAEHNRLLLGNLFMVLGGATAVMLLVAAAAALWGGVRAMPRAYLLALPAIAFFSVCLEFLKTIFKIARRTLAFAVLTFCEVAANVALSLALVIGLSWHWRGRVVGMMTSTVLLGFAAMGYMVRAGMVRFSVDRESLRCILAVSLPLIPTGFSVMLMRRSGVLFIDDAFGKSAAGLYGVAMNLATVILFLSVPVINVWTPYVYEKLAQSHAPDALESLFHRFLLLAAATLLASTLFSLFSRPILDVMTTEAFSAAGRFIPWLAFGFASWALLALLTPFLVHFNRQNAIALIATAGAAVNLGLNSLLIGKFGPVGAAGSFFAANFFSALVMLVVVCRTGGSSFWPSARRRRRETRGGVALSREEIG